MILGKVMIDMEIQISGLDERTFGSDTKTFDARFVSVEPDKKYAVVQDPFYRYIAMRITSRGDDMMTGEYVDHCYGYIDEDECMLRKYEVEWGCLCYGFCKLRLWAPDMIERFGGSYTKTVKRFYFDKALYKEKYEELHGVPCEKERVKDI